MLGLMAHVTMPGWKPWSLTQVGYDLVLFVCQRTTCGSIFSFNDVEPGGLSSGYQSSNKHLYPPSHLPSSETEYSSMVLGHWGIFSYALVFFDPMHPAYKPVAFLKPSPLMAFPSLSMLDYSQPLDQDWGCTLVYCWIIRPLFRKSALRRWLPCIVY